MTADNTSSYEKAFQRERKARKIAEALLEEKSLELYEANQKLTHQYNTLEKHTEDIKQAHEEIKQTQVQLIQSEKMASVGQLAAGVAHEINNPVGYIYSNLSTLSEYLDTIKILLRKYGSLMSSIDHNASDALLKIQNDIHNFYSDEDIDFILNDLMDLTQQSIDGTQQVRDIVQSLKNFSRIDDLEAKESDINEGIENTLKIIWNEIKYTCELEKHLSKLPSLYCYPGQLNQVFMNIIINASQAMPKGGKISIKTECIDEVILISIADTGSGISDEDLTKVFNPFFTTKEIGTGTGLGLSISYEIIKKHDGDIQIKSKPGEGTQFIIKLPLNGVSKTMENNHDKYEVITA